MNKRPLLLILPTNGENVVYRVTCQGVTFQGYVRYKVTRNDTGAYIYDYQTDDATRYGVKSFLNRVLPSIINFPN